MLFPLYVPLFTGCILTIAHALPHPVARELPKPDWILEKGDSLIPPFPPVDFKVFDPLLAQTLDLNTRGPTLDLGWCRVANLVSYKDRAGVDHSYKQTEITLILPETRNPGSSLPSDYSPRLPGSRYYSDVNTLKYTKQVVDVGHTKSGRAAMIVYGRSGQPLMMNEVYKKATAAEQSRLEKQVDKMACDEAVRIAKQSQVLYTGFRSADSVLVYISQREPDKVKSVLLMDWHDSVFVKKDTPEDQMPLLDVDVGRGVSWPLASPTFIAVHRDTHYICPFPRSYLEFIVSHDDYSSSNTKPFSSYLTHSMRHPSNVLNDFLNANSSATAGKFPSNSPSNASVIRHVVVTAIQD
ncbi:hypothetical protein F5050DRAFT_1809026 [Lentinula boryana]|uniref:Uncharacterized protein n=1 Tax=Lentinula boryana TaxID=40481 RepID=A0ABQ8Q953_9AGAR|nr:hypothetical protein F5050DRAFT_1809026 [Lentinula boryana]